MDDLAPFGDAEISDSGNFSILTWLASDPSRLLADNFGLDLGMVETLPHAGRFIVAQ